MRTLLYRNSLITPDLQGKNAKKQGIGRLLVTAISDRDAPMVQGCIIVISILVVAITLVTDLLYAWLNPRVRIG